MKPVKDDNKSLSELLPTIEGHVEDLKVSNGVTPEQLVCGILFPVMTGQSKQEWKTHIASTLYPPILEELTAFLLKRKDATRADYQVEDTHLNSPNSKPYQPKSKPPPQVSLGLHTTWLVLERICWSFQTMYLPLLNIL